MRFTLKLKNPALVERWERLAPYARSAPERPACAAYTSITDSEDVLLVCRDPAFRSFVFFMRGDAREVNGALDLGSVAVLKEYKISQRFPFALAYSTTVSEQVVKKGRWMKLVTDLQRLRYFFTTDLLHATAEELDELIVFLDSASGPDVFMLNS